LGVFVVFYLLQTGSLLLQGSPAGAAAYVDGRFVGRVAGSPPGGSLRVPKLKAGYHQLRLDMPDFIPEERGFKIARRAQTSLSMTLHPCTGMLRLSSDPPSQATVRDSQKVLWTGGTPATISLPVGEYRVGLSVQDGATWSTTATIRANRTCDVSHHFPRPGTLRVVGSCWGEVFVDGTRRGETPFVANLPPGGYAVRVTGPCGEYQEAVVVVENQDVVVNPQY
jgi:hypothetical protein